MVSCFTLKIKFDDKERLQNIFTSLVSKMRICRVYLHMLESILYHDARASSLSVIWTPSFQVQIFIFGLPVFRFELPVLLKDLRVNMEKTKIMISAIGLDLLQDSGKFPRAVCCSGVGANSILCSKCKMWVHKKCSNIKGTLVAIPGYECSRCQGVACQFDGRPVTQVDGFFIYRNLGKKSTFQNNLRYLKIQNS